MIHNIHFMQRRLNGKSNAMLAPFALASLILLLAGLLVYFTNN